jgi:SAM-dependent methyltransferase
VDRREVWDWLLTVRGRRKRAARWNELWRDENWCPPWRIDQVHDAVRQAFDEGWLTDGMTALDIGCGIGYTAAWLADRGLDVLGVDLSWHAIDEARRLHAAVARPVLSFDVGDVSRPTRLPRRFDALVDRGCLHGLFPRMTPAYARNVARWSKPGGHFLLVMHCRDTTLAARREQVETLLGSTFDVIDARPTSMAGPSALEPIPGVAFRLVYRSPS